MDPNRIDHLARVIGSGQSRRRILKTLAGAALGALTVGIGRDDASAAKRRTNGNICAANANCLSNVCVNQGRNRRICGCGSPNDCPPPSDQCHVATCLAGVCGIGADPSSNTDCCSSNSDCDLGLVCRDNVCSGCLSQNDCTTSSTRQVTCEIPIGGTFGVCADFGLCVCPGTCADCPSGLICFHEGGAGCTGKSLCCPLVPRL